MTRTRIGSPLFRIEILAALLGAAWAVTLVMRGSHDEATSPPAPAVSPVAPPTGVCSESTEPALVPANHASRRSASHRNSGLPASAQAAPASADQCGAER